MPLCKRPNSPFWWYTLSVRGKRIRRSTGLPYDQKNKTAAAAIEAAARLSLERGGNLPSVATGCTLRELSVRFLAFVETSQDLQPHTRTYYRSGWRLLAISPLANLRVDRITRDDISCTTFYREVLKRGTRQHSYLPTGKFVVCSEHYAACAKRTLKVMLGKAVEWGILAARPAFTINTPPGRETLIDPASEQRIEQDLTRPYRNKYVNRARRRAWLFLTLLQDTGMRPGEAYALRIEHIDWFGSRIFIPKGKTRNARRYVAISERVGSLLSDWIREELGSPAEGWIFPSKTSSTGHLMSIERGFRTMKARTGIDARIVPYSTRHSFGTFAMEATGNVFAVSKSMGHSNIKSMEPYQHPGLSPITEAINLRNRTRDHRLPNLGHTTGHTDILIQ